MAAAVKKFNEERDTFYLGAFNRDNYIRADTGVCWFFRISKGLAANIYNYCIFIRFITAINNGIVLINFFFTIVIAR